MHRFFVSGPAAGPGREPSGDGDARAAGFDALPAWSRGTELELSETDAVHVARVLRLKIGQAVVVSDGRGFDYEASLVRVSPKSVVVRLAAPQRSKAEPGLFLTLIQGVAKGGKMDFVIQKAVEVGVSRIIPAETEHTVVRLKGDKADGRVERWRRIAYEAAKQAGRSRVPTVDPVHAWPAVWRKDDLGVVLVPWEGADGSGLLDTVQRLRGQTVPGPEGAGVSRVAVVIGPEGGLSAKEVALAEGAGAHAVTLGPRILRTETAAIVACSLVLAAFGELG